MWGDLHIRAFFLGLLLSVAVLLFVMGAFWTTTHS
jgi:hypothetical protein